MVPRLDFWQGSNMWLSFWGYLFVRAEDIAETKVPPGFVTVAGAPRRSLRGHLGHWGQTEGKDLFCRILQLDGSKCLFTINTRVVKWKSSELTMF